MKISTVCKIVAIQYVHAHTKIENLCDSKQSWPSDNPLGQTQNLLLLETVSTDDS